LCDAIERHRHSRHPKGDFIRRDNKLAIIHQRSRLDHRVLGGTGQIARVAAAMVSVGLLEREGEAIKRPSEGSAAEAQFRICAEIVEPFLEHYYLCMIYLLEHGSGVLDKPEVVQRCADAAEQLAMLYTLSSPDLFEAALFENLIEALLSQGLIEEDGEGRLCFGASLGLVAADLGLVLRPRVRQTLRTFAGAATTAPLSAAGEDGTP